MDDIYTYVQLVEAVAAAAAFFLLIRKLLLWYWRVNEIVRLLRSIDASLRTLPAVREARAATWRQAQAGRR